MFWSLNDSCNARVAEIQTLCNSLLMTLAEFIRERGDRCCAQLFGVKERTVASWRRGENLPRATKAREIVGLTSLQMSDIYGGRDYRHKRTDAAGDVIVSASDVSTAGDASAEDLP